MQRASADGLVDYRNWNARNSADLFGEYLAFNKVERESAREIINLKHARVCALLAFASNLPDKTELFKESMSRLDALEYDMGRLQMPWIEFEKPGGIHIKASEVEELKTAWEARFGKIDSPENQKLFATLSHRIHEEGSNNPFQGVDLIPT